MTYDEYKFYAGPKGRVVARQIKAYKKHIAVLYCIIGALTVATVALTALTGGN